MINKGAKGENSEKGNIIVTDKYLTDYLKGLAFKNKHNYSSKNIHERLYNEKDKYFNLKNGDKEFKLEEEMKLCTFKPELSHSSSSKSQLRNFDQVYSSIMDY